MFVGVDVCVWFCVDMCMFTLRFFKLEAFEMYFAKFHLVTCTFAASPSDLHDWAVWFFAAATVGQMSKSFVKLKMGFKIIAPLKIFYIH